MELSTIEKLAAANYSFRLFEQYYLCSIYRYLDGRIICDGSVAPSVNSTASCGAVSVASHKLIQPLRCAQRLPPWKDGRASRKVGA